MDLISREKAIDALDVTINNTVEGKDLSAYESEIHELGQGIYNTQKGAMESLPSAFEGMTVGEVVETIFPNFTFQKAQDEYTENKCVFMSDGEHLICDFPLDFWDSPYKGVSK